MTWRLLRRTALQALPAAALLPFAARAEPAWKPSQGEGLKLDVN